MPLILDPQDRQALWQQVLDVMETYVQELPSLPVAPALDPEGLRRRLATLDFSRPMQPREAIAFASQQLRAHQVHVGHPSYYGLFNPAPTSMGIAGDALVAAFNPQLAAWSHSPFAVELERHLVQQFGMLMGYGEDSIEGTFCSGGMEANHTALLSALNHAFPTWSASGVRGLPSRPVFYVSAEAHDSFRKAAALCGLGQQAARAVPTDPDLRMDVQALTRSIAGDRAAGHHPFMVVATLGTTAAGAVDPVQAIAGLARQEGLWCHADAAWGGAVALDPELRPLLRGIEDSHSITLDAHKWLAVPMGAGIFMTRRPGILQRTFAVSQHYMPAEGAHLDVRDPFATSMQWSRRFIGLKLFLSLAVAGWDGYRQEVRRMHDLGQHLKALLVRHGWRPMVSTPLPIVCFRDGHDDRGQQREHLQRIAAAVVASGRAWISTAKAGGRTALRACISSCRTEVRHVEDLVAALNEARQKVSSSTSPTHRRGQ